MHSDYSHMSETVVCVRNGRVVLWSDVTTEDLNATISNYPRTQEAVFARGEWLRRIGSEHPGR